jgi:serine/threonine protein kinase
MRRAPGSASPCGKGDPVPGAREVVRSWGRMPPDEDGDSVDSFLREVAAISELAPDEPVALPALEVGQLVGDRFLVEERAGSGGMGAVYRAQDRTTQARAALKIMARPHRSGAERFAREARVLAELSHPAIVRYLTHGMAPNGLPFLAMDWLEGEDLESRLGRSGLSVSESLALVRRACEGLAVAHAKGVVHRDIKPSNLFLVGGEPGACKIIDFGIARFEAGVHALTRPGTSLGTAGYMAPEQALEATDVDARADVYALGCVLYECITGRPAFSGRPVAVMAKVLRELPPRPRELVPELDSALDRLVMTLLSKDRNARPSGVAELSSALDALGASSP